MIKVKIKKNGQTFYDEKAFCWRGSTHVNLLMQLTYHVSMVYVGWQSDVLVEHSLASPLKENLMGLVAEGLDLDFTRLLVHWVVGEVHLAAVTFDIEMSVLLFWRYHIFW